MKEFAGHSVRSHVFMQDYICWQDKEVEKNFHRRLFGPIGPELSRPQDLDITISPCMQLFKTGTFKDIRFEDIRKIGNFEDGLYQMDIYRNCRTFVYIDKPFYHYRKTNESSITTKYSPELLEKRECLFNMIENRIVLWKLDSEYQKAFKNRIALNIIGLGINETHARRGFHKLVTGGVIC